MTNTTKRRYGWKPSLPDQRDLWCKAFPPTLDRVTITDHVDLSQSMPPCYDQGELGSCTANALAGVLQYDEIAQKRTDQTTPSRLFIYYNERALDPNSSVSEDTGSSIHMGIKAVRTYGFCDEALWPYDINEFSIEPPATTYLVAKNERISNYCRVAQVLQQLQGVLIDGHPFAFGFSVYESFQSQQVADTGVVPMPRRREQLVGGHAVMCVGYDNATQRFLVRNSWGPDWGQNGYFTIPYSYLLNPWLALDFWVINAIP
jgi:C1A family cysteine protease